MTSLEDAVQVAIDTLVVQCRDTTDSETDRSYGKRGAAEAILNYHRDMSLLAVGGKGINVTVNGAVPVRPMTRSEV